MAKFSSCFFIILQKKGYIYIGEGVWKRDEKGKIRKQENKWEAFGGGVVSICKSII